MKFVTKFLITFISVVILTTSCRQSAQKEGEQSSDMEMVEQKDIEQELQDIANPLPEPFEVYSMLENIGASYLGKVLNSPENAETYFTQKSKAVNAGVYAADLAYAVTYNNKEDIKTYSSVLKSILDDLGLNFDYTSLQSEIMKQKLMDKDTLIKYVSKIYVDTYEFLYKESAPSYAALMVSGAWVEGLYIASHISEDTYQNYDIVKIIYDQGKSLNKLVEFLGKYTDQDELVSSYYDAFFKLKTLYDNTNGSLTEKQLNDIISTIEVIRDSMIS